MRCQFIKECRIGLNRRQHLGRQPGRIADHSKVFDLYADLKSASCDHCRRRGNFKYASKIVVVCYYALAASLGIYESA